MICCAVNRNQHTKVLPSNFQYLRSNPRFSHGIAGRVITVKWGDQIRRIGIDGSSKAIKEAVRTAFGLRTKRPFWVEDNEGILPSIDRHIPFKDYNLRLDSGLTVKVYFYDAHNDASPVVYPDDKTFYAEDNFRDILLRHGLAALTALTCRKNVDSIDDLHPGEVYQGLRVLVLSSYGI